MPLWFLDLSRLYLLSCLSNFQKVSGEIKEKLFFKKKILHSQAK
jgi:hypothetical protein